MELAEVSTERLAANDVCAIATDRYHRIALWRQLFTVLIFAVGVTITVFLVLTIVFATNKEWAATVATGSGLLSAASLYGGS